MTPDAVYLDAASVRDVSALADLEKDASTHPWTEAHFEAAIRGAAGERVVVLRGRDRKAIGFCVWQEVADEAHIHNVAIAGDHQRRGLARRLLRVCLGLAGGRQARRAFLDVRASNRPAIGLYRNLGFRETGSRAGYYANPVEDALLLEAAIRSDGLANGFLKSGEGAC